MSKPKSDFLKLSVAERILFVEDIWDSIAEENTEAAALTPAQLQEIQARLDAHEQDPSTSISWEKVHAELLQRNS